MWKLWFKLLHNLSTRKYKIFFINQYLLFLEFSLWNLSITYRGYSLASDFILNFLTMRYIFKGSVTQDSKTISWNTFIARRPFHARRRVLLSWNKNSLKRTVPWDFYSIFHQSDHSGPLRDFLGAFNFFTFS